MGKEYFIMMTSPSGITVIPMVDDNDRVLLFNTYNDAKLYAEEHPWASKLGYEIFKRGSGE
jgi:hypothetical protein